MRVDDFERIKNDVLGFLNGRNKLGHVKFIFLEQRYFSYLYEIQCLNGNDICKYILKVSTTNRSCKNEYEQYLYLDKKNIRSLKPVFFSEELNYLITKKENLASLDTLLCNCRNINKRKHYFYKLGEMLKDIDLKTGESARFKEQEYKDYVTPRIKSLKKLNNREKAEIINKIEVLSSRLRNQIIRKCFVSDFSLGNIHMNSEGDIVLVDMGDATFGNHYDNISNIYLTIKFGPMAQYIDFNGNSYKYFMSFLEGYEIDKINDELFALFKIKHLINMVSFISNLKVGTKNILYRLIARISNVYLIFRYKKYLLRTINIK